MKKLKYAINLRCWECNATGIGRATDESQRPNFLIRALPVGFKQTRLSPKRWEQEFAHECGGLAEYDLA